jgi:hypothetical protein
MLLLEMMLSLPKELKLIGTVSPVFLCYFSPLDTLH